MTSTEIESLVVRLNGDASGYSKMLKDAQKQTADVAKDLENTTKEIEGFGKTIKKFGDDIKSGLAAFGLWTYVVKATDRATGDLKKGLEELGSSFDQSINATIEPLVKGLQSITAQFKEMPQWVKDAAASIGTLAAGAVGVSLLVTYCASLVTTVKELSLVLIASPITPWVVGVVAGYIALEQLVKAIDESHASTKELNKELERGALLNEQLAIRNTAYTNKRVIEINKIYDPMVRQRKLSEELADAEKTLTTRKEAADTAQKALADIGVKSSKVTPEDLQGAMEGKSFEPPMAAVGRLAQQKRINQVDTTVANADLKEKLRLAKESEAIVSGLKSQMNQFKDTNFDQIMTDAGTALNKIQFDTATVGMTDYEKSIQALQDRLEDLGYDVEKFMPKFKQLNDTLQEMKKAGQERDFAKLQKEFQDQIEHAQGVDPKLKAINKYADESGDQAGAQKLRDMRTQVIEQERLNKYTAEAQDLLTQYTDALETEGMSARESAIYMKERKLGLTDEITALKDVNYQLTERERHKEMVEKGVGTTIQFRTKDEVFTDRIKELNAQLDEGVISWETYTRALDAAQKAAMDVKSAINFSAALSGSAEAITRISQYKDAISRSLPPGARAAVDGLARKGPNELGDALKNSAHQLAEQMGGQPDEAAGEEGGLFRTRGQNPYAPLGDQKQNPYAPLEPLREDIPRMLDTLNQIRDGIIQQVEKSANAISVEPADFGE